MYLLKIRYIFSPGIYLWNFIYKKCALVSHAHESKLAIELAPSRLIVIRNFKMYGIDVLRKFFGKD